MTKIVCISDTHGKEDSLNMPEGDILIHAGDITSTGESRLLEKFNDWVKSLPYEEVFVIPGNHDRTIPKNPLARKLLKDCTLLIDETAQYKDFNIYGSPWTPAFGFGWAYNASRGPSIQGIWNKIPSNTDILITHGPPYGILDSVPRISQPQGCQDLLTVVRRIKPKLSVFGHLHLQGGQQKYLFGSNTIFVNAAVCNEDYEPINPIVVVDIEGSK